MARASSRCFLAETAVMRLGTILPRSDTYRINSLESLKSIFGAFGPVNGQVLRRRKNGRRAPASAMFLLLDHCIGIVTPAPWTVTTITTTVTIATEAAVAVAADPAATVVAITIAIRLAHHGRRTFFVFFDANGQIANHVFADPLLALDLGDSGRRRVDIQQHKMCLAVLVHAVGQRTHAPVLGLGDLAARLCDDAGHLGGQFFDLLGARILTREKNMLIKRHGCPFQVLARFPAASPSNPSERTRISSEGGSTGRRTDWPCHINIADKVKLLRPSVQLPAGIHGWRGL